MHPFKRLWSKRPFRWLSIVVVMLLLLGAGRLTEVVWDSNHFGARGPYLQRLTPHDVVVRWQTAAWSEGRVRYGASAEQLTRTADDGSLGTAHEVRLTGLEPATRYFYAIGEGEPIPFITPPLPGTAQPVRFWAVGDSGLAGDNLHAMRDAALRWMGENPREGRALFDFGLALGDNAYTSGTNPQYQASYFGPFAEVLRSFMIWPVYGNHDARRFTYFNVFTLPEQGEAGGVASGTENWYAFDHGPVHVVVLDSEASDRSADAPMLRWLREDLAANKQPWVVAALHHPPYTKGSHDSDRPGDSRGRMIEMREHALPLLEAAGVDLVLSGHSHSYERSHLLDCHYGMSDSLVEGMVLARGGREALFHKPSAALGAHEGTVYVVAGASSKMNSGKFNHPAMSVSGPQLGSLVVDVDGARMEVRYIDSSGAVWDSFTIRKDAGPAFLRPSVCGAVASRE